MITLLRQLSNYKNLSNVPHILFGTLVVDLVTILLVKNSNVLGTTLNEWYDQFGLSAVLADVLVIVLGILIAQYIYTVLVFLFSPPFSTPSRSDPVGSRPSLLRGGHSDGPSGPEPDD